MTFLRSIFKELQNKPQHYYSMATNSCRNNWFFITETWNRKPKNRGICNHNRNFKNRARKLNSGYAKLSNFWDLAFIICLFHKIGCSVISRPLFADSLNFIILENSHHFFGNTKSNVFTAFAILWCLENNKTFEMFFCLNFWVVSWLGYYFSST